LSFLDLLSLAAHFMLKDFISLISTIFMSLIQPGEESAPDIPRLDLLKIWREQGDFTGALNEYFFSCENLPIQSIGFI
jgi:hypothetical protein